MTPRSNANQRRRERPSRSRRSKTNEILIFGEDKHDSDAIKCLIQAINPKLSKECSLRVQRDPGSLTRGALPVKVDSWMDDISKQVEIRSRVAEIRAVLVHQDSDAADAENRNALQSALSRNLTAPAHPVVPVQETESWWLLYPECFRQVKPGAWRDVVLPTGRNVETIKSPKEFLIRQTKSVSPKNSYTEADSLAIAQNIAFVISQGLEPDNSSASWNKFLEIANSI